MSEERRENPNNEVRPVTREEVVPALKEINESSERSFRDYVGDLRRGGERLRDLAKSLGKLKQKEQEKKDRAEATVKKSRSFEDNLKIGREMAEGYGDDWINPKTKERLEERKTHGELGEKLAKGEMMTNEEITDRLQDVFGGDEIDGLPHPPVNNQERPMERKDDSQEEPASYIMREKPTPRLEEMDEKQYVEENSAYRDRQGRNKERRAGQEAAVIAQERKSMEEDVSSILRTEPTELEIKHQQISEELDRQESEKGVAEEDKGGGTEERRNSPLGRMRRIMEAGGADMEKSKNQGGSF